MKVCFIVGTLGRGGAERQLIFMLRALLSARIEARILCLTKGEAFEAEIKSLGVEIEYVGKNQNRFWRLFKIIQNLRKHPADIIQSSHFYTNIYAAVAGKILKSKSIGAIRNNLTSEIEYHKYLGKLQVFLPDFLIANSETAYQNTIIYGIHSNKVEFVRNVVKLGIDESERSLMTKKNLTLLFVGRLHSQKRPDRFIRLAAALIKKYPRKSLKFQIAGDGTLRNELEAEVKNNSSLTNKFEFLGECAEMSEIYRQADILVLTSDYEGTPNVVLEAMAHCLPVIASNVGGTGEILKKKRGILVDPNDEIGFLNAASELIENPAKRQNLGAEGFRYVKNNHSLETLTKNLTEIYEKLVKQKESKIGLKQKPI